MKQASVYLKMRILGAIDTVQGKTRHERIHHVAAMTFLDEEGTCTPVHLAHHSNT